MSTTVGKNLLLRNEVALAVNKRVWNAVLGCNLKSNRMILVCFQSKLFSITVIQVYDSTTKCQRSWIVLWRPTRPFRTNTKKNVPFIIGNWNAIVGSQEIPGVTGKFWPWSTKWSRAKAKRVLPRDHTSHSKHPSSNNMRNSSSHGHHQMVNTKIRLIIFFAAEDREALYSQQKQDWELTMAQIMNSLLKNSDLNWRK